MWKLISASLKSFVDNIELMLVLFTSSIFVKYIISISGNSNVLLIYFSLILNLFLITASVSVLCMARKNNSWNWKEYLVGGIKNFPFTICWILCIIGMFRIAGLLSSILNMKQLFRFSSLVVLPAAYIFSLVPIAKIAGFKLKKAVEMMISLVKDHFMLVVSIGIFVAVVMYVSNAVTLILWSKAVEFESMILSRLLVIAGELVKGSEYVVIMATLVNLLLLSTTDDKEVTLVTV
jgi:hypothetical protein